ncbi:RNA polymerase sigma factor [Rossellomorea vietnamensis]|uniref:RNA polymerase sigma factor n=2 Tax=Rossellomorea vietnamensis TaxID=218284 RepID=A0A5D4MEI3_9BACI|nr:RNA polymerase sigma factor [Rossellomorea vietnamensis]
MCWLQGGMELKESNLHELYESCFQDVYHYLLYFTNSHSEAEDLTQETFIKAYKNYARFEHRSSINTWILSIARRTAVDHYRKRKMISLVPELIGKLEKNSRGNPLQELERNDDYHTLQKALSTLKPDYRNVVILRGLKEYSVKETAEILGWKETKVKVNYHRAIKRLKGLLSKSHEGEVIFHEQKRG